MQTESRGHLGAMGSAAGQTRLPEPRQADGPSCPSSSILATAKGAIPGSPLLEVEWLMALLLTYDLEGRPQPLITELERETGFGIVQR